MYLRKLTCFVQDIYGNKVGSVKNRNTIKRIKKQLVSNDARYASLRAKFLAKSGIIESSPITQKDRDQSALDITGNRSNVIEELKQRHLIDEDDDSMELDDDDNDNQNVYGQSSRLINGISTQRKTDDSV